MFRTARIIFQSTGLENQSATLRVFILPLEGVGVHDTLHAALDDVFGRDDARRIVSFEFVN